MGMRFAFLAWVACAPFLEVSPQWNALRLCFERKRHFSLPRMARNRFGCRACGTTRSSRFRDYVPVVHDVLFTEKGPTKPNSMVVCDGCNRRCTRACPTLPHEATVPDGATSESDNKEAPASENEESSDHNEEDNISEAPAQPRVEKARSRRFCREKCQLCGVGSSCKFYNYGTSVICERCYRVQRKTATTQDFTCLRQLQVQHDSVDESDVSDSSSSSNKILVSIRNDETAISTDVGADEPDQSRIWSTEVSDVSGTLEGYLITHAGSPDRASLLAVARAVLKHGAIQLQEALEIYNSCADQKRINVSHFRDHLLRNLALTAFSGARKHGWMLMERTEEYHSVLSRLLQRIGKLQTQLDKLDQLSVEKYRGFEELMDAQQRQMSRYLLLQVFGAVEVKKRFGITNIDAVAARVEAMQSEFANSELGVHAARRKSLSQLRAPRKGGRIAWEQKPEVAAAVIAEVEHNGVKIHPSLNDRSVFAVDTTLKQLSESLKRKLPEEDVPSPSALSKGLDRQGPEARRGIKLKFHVTKKVLGAAHEHRALVQWLHQNLRDFFVSDNTYHGEVALLCMDDLEKMPLNQLAYNGKQLTISGQDRTAPTYNFAEDNQTRKLIFSTYLVLTTDTRANRDRREEKKPPLQRIRTAVSQLPLQARLEHSSSSDVLQKVNIIETDRSGIPIVVIKSWAKDKKEHTNFSQPSTALQHAEDLVQFSVQATRRGASAEFVPLQKHLGKNGHVTPYLILATDGASEHSVRSLQNVLPLWEVLRILDLDGIEKLHFCPGHSKDNPDEMLNRTVKRSFKGRYVDAGDGDRDKMEAAKHAAADALRSKTHAGESMHVFVSPAGGVQWRERERGKYELNIEDYDTLYAFAVERVKHAPLWFDKEKDPSPEVVQKWKEEEPDFYALEQLTQLVKKHLVYLHLYGVGLRKCHGNTPPCAFCKEHPPRGSFIANSAREFELDDCDPENPCPTPICKHKLNAQYGEIMKQLSAITPDDMKLQRKCGHCRREGHDVRKCDQLPPDHPKRNRPRKKQKNNRCIKL